MSRINPLLVAAILACLAGNSVQASLQERERRSLHSAKPSRILNVYTDAEHLFIAGQNLPSGEGTQVLIGDRVLEVVSSSRSLVVARLPDLALEEGDRLEVKRGVRRARIRGNAVRWGFQLPLLPS